MLDPIDHSRMTEGDIITTHKQTMVMASIAGREKKESLTFGVSRCEHVRVPPTERCVLCHEL